MKKLLAALGAISAGERRKQIRTHLGLSLIQAAQAFDVTPEFYEHFEAGRVHARFIDHGLLLLYFASLVNATDRDEAPKEQQVRAVPVFCPCTIEPVHGIEQPKDANFFRCSITGKKFPLDRPREAWPELLLKQLHLSFKNE